LFLTLCFVEDITQYDVCGKNHSQDSCLTFTAYVWALNRCHCQRKTAIADARKLYVT